MKLLVLGSDFGTIDLVNEAHKEGDYVVVADYYKTTSTKMLADECWDISTRDIDLVVEKAKSAKIEAICVGASDGNVEAYRKIAKGLGLPFYCKNDSAWNLTRNKREFKDLCAKIGAPIATDYFVNDGATDEELDNIVFPVVVKAVDLSANVGFSYCDNKEELKSAIEKVHIYSKNPTFIVERRLYGPEFVANYILADGEIVLNHFCAEHHEPGYPANLYSIINSTNYLLSQYIEELNDKVIELFKRAGFTDGIAWVECMRDTDGHFYLIEPGYRFCGEVTHMAYGHLIDFNPAKWMLDIAKGIKHTKDDLPAPLQVGQLGSSVSYHLFGSQDGVVAEILGLDAIAKIPEVVIDLPHRVGYNMRKFKNMGVVRFPCFSKKELIDKISLINSNLQVLDENGDNLFVKYTNIDEIIEQYEKGLQMSI